MQNELNKLQQYATDNGITVVFTDSAVLKDYAAMNPEAARAMGFPDIDNKLETKEILVDKTVPEKEQVKNLKHELIEMKLMKEGLEYWPSHEIALRDENKPFDYTQSITAIQPTPLPASFSSQYSVPITPIKKKKRNKAWFKKGHRKGIASGYKLDFEGFKDF